MESSEHSKGLTTATCSSSEDQGPVLLTGIDRKLLEKQRLQLVWVLTFLDDCENIFGLIVPNKEEMTDALEGLQNMLDTWSDRQVQLKEIQPLLDKATAWAREHYADTSDNDLEIDDEPFHSESEDGIWVSAWVWVPMDVLEEG